MASGCPMTYPSNGSELCETDLVALTSSVGHRGFSFNSMPAESSWVFLWRCLLGFTLWHCACVPLQTSSFWDTCFQEPQSIYLNLKHLEVNGTLTLSSRWNLTCWLFPMTSEIGFLSVNHLGRWFQASATATTATQEENSRAIQILVCMFVCKEP